jgi:polygalacturonase
VPRLVNVIFFTSFIATTTALAATPTVDITQAGAVGNGTTLNTPAIQKAVDDLAAKGGGTLRSPAGRYLWGTVEM